MANLIITVISIALVAVAALIATYYGGAAFSAASYKGKANTVIEQSKQLAAAWQLWSVNNDNTKDLVDADWTTATGGGTADDLVPTYTTQLPTPPLDAEVAGDGWHPALEKTGFTSPQYQTVEFDTPYTDEAQKVCRALMDVTQSPATGISISATVVYLKPPTDCFISDADASGTGNTGDIVTFRHKVF